VWYNRAKQQPRRVSLLQEIMEEGPTVSRSHKENEGTINKGAAYKCKKINQPHKKELGRTNRILHAHAFCNCKLQNYCKTLAGEWLYT